MDMQLDYRMIVKYMYNQEKWLITILLTVRKHKQLSGTHSVLSSFSEDS